MTITSSTAKTLFRFVPLTGEEGTYRIIVKNRKGGCNRFLSAFEECSTTRVGLAKEDFREGLQRWVFTRVQPEDTPAPATPAPTTPAPVTLTPQPSINPPPEAPTPQTPTIKSAYATSSTSGKVTVGFGGIESDADCIVNLSPGRKNKKIAVSPRDNEISVEFMDLNPATKYTATAVIQPKNGGASPTSEPESFTTPGIPYVYNPGSDTICDGRGEVSSGDGQCICNGEDVDYGPFVPRNIGGCKCADGLVDLGYGPCTCLDPSMKTSEGLCKCPVMYSLCDTDTVCCPCTQYVPVADIRASDNGGCFGYGSWGGTGALDINAKGDLIVATDICTEDDNGNQITNGWVYSYNGSNWVETIINLGTPDPGSYLNGNSVATNGDGTLLLLGDYDWNAGEGDGAVFLFEKVDDNWVLKQTFFGDQYTADFGYSVSMDKAGNVIVISDVYNLYPGYEQAPWGTSIYRGTHYIYRRSGDQYISEANLTASDWDPDSYEGDYFCDGIISGDGQVIAAREYKAKPGKVYMIKYTETGWDEVQILTGSQTESDKQFGRSLNINDDGSVVVVGDPYTNNGQVYVFRYNGTLWEEADVLIGDNTASVGSNFGYSVDINAAGDVLVVGDYDADTDGRVYIFRYLDDAWTQVQMLQGSTNFKNTLGKFGWKVVINDAGDVIGIGDSMEHVYVFQNTCG